MIISSTANPQIKAIRKLRDRKERLQSGLFTIEGLRIIGEAVEQGADIQSMVIAPGLLTSEFGHQLLEHTQKKGIPALEVSDEVFTSLALKDNPQGLAAVVHQKYEPIEKIKLNKGGLWVALDSVADPGNLGTIMRTLDSIGGQGIILLDQTTDPYDPTAVRASMGALFSLTLVKTTFDFFKAWKENDKVELVGASGGAAKDYHGAKYPESFVLLMGSERQGLSEHYMNLCDLMVSIPMVGRSDSLNLAVSTAVVLYEVFNQRRDQRAHKEEL